MEQNEIVEQIKLALVKVLKHERFEITESLKASEVEGWDSLTHMLIINEIEGRFKVRFKLKELNSLLNVGNLIALIKSKQ